MNFVTVSHFGASNPSILQQFHALEPPTLEFCDSFTFWSLQPLNFETVFHFGARTPKNAVLSSICGSGGPKMLYRRQFLASRGRGRPGEGFGDVFLVESHTKSGGRAGSVRKIFADPTTEPGLGWPQNAVLSSIFGLAGGGGPAGGGFLESFFGRITVLNRVAGPGRFAKNFADPTTEPLRGNEELASLALCSPPFIHHGHCSVSVA